MSVGGSVKIGSLFLALMVTSCQTPKPGDKDYVAWVRDYKNGMHARHVQNDLAYDLQYQPAEYVWMQKNGTFDAEEFEIAKNEFDKMDYFVLNINSADGTNDVIKQRSKGNREIANELLYYFSYRFQNDISLEEGPRVQPVLLFHYEQHGTKSFVLGFEKSSHPLKEFTLIMTSAVLDSIPVKIKVSTDPNVL